MKKCSFQLIKKSIKKNWVNLVFILGISISVAVLIFSLTSCTKEYNIEIQDNQSYINSYYLMPSAECPNGEYHLEYYEDSVLVFSHSECRDFGDTIIINLSDTTIIVLPPDTTMTIIDTVFVQGHNIIREVFRDNFNNSGNSPYYASVGYWLGSGFSINQLDDNWNYVGNGTIVQWDNLEIDTMRTPELFSEPMVVDSISFFVGSRTSWKINPFIIDNFGIFISLDCFNLTGNLEFDWQNLETYDWITYSVAFSENNPKAVKFGLIVIKADKFSLCVERNEKFNADNLLIRGTEILD